MLPSGTFSEEYRQDMAIVRTRMQWGLVIIAFLIFLFVLPQFTSEYILSLINVIAITIICVHGLNILTGYCGQISIGQAAFMGVGAFSAGILTTRFGLSFWAALPCSALSAALIGIVFGLPALRLKGFYLAMTTLAAQFIITYAILHGGDFTSGIFGIVVPRPTIGGIVINTEKEYFYLIMPITILMTFFALNLMRTRLGRAFIAIRDNDLAAEAMGISLYRYKLLAFFICSIFAGVAGCLWAHYVAGAHHEHYTLMDSIWMLGMLIVGGMGSTMGVVFGVTIIKLLSELVAWGSPIIGEAFPAISGPIFAALGLAVNGLAIMLFLIFEPRGVNHRWVIFKSYYRLFPFSY